uniref:Uncharacterized protein n=1 Tax=viral metagenome TaxID=1070528 RepID=A0A6C0J386_9ZZZZ
MNIQTLSLIHKTLLIRSKKYQYQYYPCSLVSLSKKTPSEEDIKKDYEKITSHFSHPIFINFVPKYEDSVKCFKGSWYTLYLKELYNN